MRNIIKALVLLIVLANCSRSQLISYSRQTMTGNIRSDLLWSFSERQDSLENSSIESEKKSPFSAALYSVVLPGAGQLYTASYLESIGFIGAEITLWVVYGVHNSRGDKKTSEYQEFADFPHWSVVRYVEWMKQYFPGQSGNITINPNTNLPPWERVDWNQLNDSEDQIGRLSNSGFTHRLPRRPEQQYYELIGKYPQYGGGWDDAGNFSPSDVLQGNVSERFLFYSSLRGDANGLYKIATTASYFLIANHVLSALEAAWGAARFNSRLKAEAHLVPIIHSRGLVEFVPTVRLTVGF